MRQSQTRRIMAIVTLDEKLIPHADAPTFIAKDQEQMELIASELGRTLIANVYELSNGVIIITQA